MNKKKEFKDMHIIGGGIAGLSAAVYLIKEGKIDGKKIVIYDKAQKFGGCLDGKYSKKGKGYKIRGIRVFQDTAYTCTMDLMKKIPSLKNKKKTIKKDFKKFNKKTRVYFKSRLVKNGKILDTKNSQIGLKDKLKLIKLLFTNEDKIQKLQINQYFSKEFFSTNFRYEFSTVFAFQQFHSLAEARRYILRSIHCSQYFDTLEPLQVTTYNQYEDMILPIVSYLKDQGVKFKNNTKITKINFKKYNNQKKVTSFLIERKGISSEITLENEDYAFISLGSMTASSSIGTMTKAPIEKITKAPVSRSLWEDIAKGNPDFGKPKVFCNKINKTKWISFTMTLKNKKVLELFEKFLTADIALGGTTIVDSNWYLSLGIHPKPFFVDQDKESSIIWGYCMNSEKKGNYVKKKMKDCNGKEIIEEFVHHLGLQENLKFILDNSVCIPCMTPYVTSHFMPRQNGDRPKVIPDSAKNFAFLGQYTEIPDDIVFTVEYSIRSAQIAVYGLLGLDKKVNPIYKGITNPKVMFTALKTIYK